MSEYSQNKVTAFLSFLSLIPPHATVAFEMFMFFACFILTLYEQSCEDETVSWWQQQTAAKDSSVLASFHNLYTEALPTFLVLVALHWVLSWKSCQCAQLLFSVDLVLCRPKCWCLQEQNSSCWVGTKEQPLKGAHVRLEAAALTGLFPCGSLGEPSPPGVQQKNLFYWEWSLAKMP